MTTEKECIECFQGEYKFRGCDWDTGEYWSILPSGSICYNKKIEVDLLKREKLPLSPEYWEKTINLTSDKISLFFFSKNKKLDDIRNQSLLENATDVHFYWKYKNCRKHFYEKLLYVHDRNELIEKIKIRYPCITDEEIWKFFKLYLCYHPNENGDHFFLWGKAASDLQFWFCGPLPERGRKPRIYFGEWIQWFWNLFPLVFNLFWFF